MLAGIARLVCCTDADCLDGVFPEVHLLEEDLADVDCLVEALAEAGDVLPERGCLDGDFGVGDFGVGDFGVGDFGGGDLEVEGCFWVAVSCIGTASGLVTPWGPHCVSEFCQHK